MIHCAGQWKPARVSEENVRDETAVRASGSDRESGNHPDASLLLIG
jgi:hypothetical protein